MRSRISRPPDWLISSLFVFFFGYFFLGAWMAEASAQTVPTVVRVEEDWELVVDKPDADSAGPQAVTVISPSRDVDSHYAAFEINSQSLPSFTPGGLQLQLWNGRRSLDSRKFPNAVELATPGETVCWTQSVALDGGNLVFEITNGTSTTWDDFGGQGYLRTSTATHLTNLSGYSPAVSVANSGVSYAAHRVGVLRLKTIRYCFDTGDPLEISVNHAVHTQDVPSQD